jgi:hypothetical protein
MTVFAYGMLLFHLAEDTVLRAACRSLFWSPRCSAEFSNARSTSTFIRAAIYDQVLFTIGLG